MLEMWLMLVLYLLAKGSWPSLGIYPSSLMVNLLIPFFLALVVCLVVDLVVYVVVYLCPEGEDEVQDLRDLEFSRD